MGDTLWLPVTPSIRRIARDYLGFDVWLSGHWGDPDDEAPDDYDYDEDRGEFVRYDPERGELVEWRSRPLLYLHIPAGLAIARARLAEVNPDDAPAVTDPADVRAYLLEHDPEVTLAADGREKES